MAQVISKLVGTVCLIKVTRQKKRRGKKNRPFGDQFANANFIFQTSTWPGDLAANSPIPHTKQNHPKNLIVYTDCLAHTYWGLKLEVAEEGHRQVDPCVPTSVPFLLVGMVQQVPTKGTPS